jgi:UDP-hydrolysing UDP-N-acetyl-D-glucosamine 2-epimerase
MTSKKKIYFLNGKKGGFDAMLPLLKLIKKKDEFNLKILLTDQHLNKKFGNTYRDCEREIGKKNIILIKLNTKSDDSHSRSISMSKLLIKLSEQFSLSKPDLLMVYGDRMESLVASLAAVNFDISICHFQGGDLSGNLDEKIRHSITKLSDLHLTSNKKSLLRVKQMGEDPKNIFCIGDSHIDSIRKIQFKKSKVETIKKKYGLAKPYTVFMLHPDGISNIKNKKNCANTLAALKKFRLDCICIYPCTDIGHEGIIYQLKKFSKINKNFKVYKFLPHEDFIILLKNCKFFIGNSSSGIIESAYLKTPFINLGNRQKGRSTSSNVLHSSFDRKKIIKNIKIISSDKFRKKNLKKIDLIYGKGLSYLKAYKIIKSKINTLSKYKIFYE